ncbi:MAG: hypothetical protein QNJ94_09255 [Alphaproteobacteria bacterium]|nr:hypothetical protein [Alphaproteobacteria bacterium]
MRLLQATVAATVLVVAAPVLISGFGSAAKVQPLDLAMEDDFRTHYDQAPVRPDWRITRIAWRGSNVEIRLAVPGHQAAGLLKSPIYVLYKSLATVCPAPDAAIWDLLTPDQDIVIRGTTGNGDVFHDLSCRNYGA